MSVSKIFVDVRSIRQISTLIINKFPAEARRGDEGRGTTWMRPSVSLVMVKAEQMSHTAFSRFCPGRSRLGRGTALTTLVNATRRFTWNTSHEASVYCRRVNVNVSRKGSMEISVNPASNIKHSNILSMQNPLM